MSKKDRRGCCLLPPFYVLLCCGCGLTGGFFFRGYFLNLLYMPHCGCDTNKPYNFATVAEWDANRMYNDNEEVKMEGVIYKARGTRFENTTQPGMMFPIPILRHFLNMGQRPPNPDYWVPVPFENCYDTSRCAPPQLTSPPMEAPPPSALIAQPDSTSGAHQSVIPTPPQAPYTDSTSIMPSGPIYDFDSDDDENPPPAQPIIPAFNLPQLPQLPNIPKLENIETKHMILGMAGVLTLMLL
jgi:hypothetical protein